MWEVVKKEILKLLHAGIIYPVPHSECVSPVQVVPKKGGMTVRTVTPGGGCALTTGNLTRPLRRITSHYHSLMRC
jgi:hypothetical protein